MSVYLLPKTTIKSLDKIRRTFFGKGVEQKRNISLLNGRLFVKVKRKEVWELKINISLLCKWWWELEKEEGLWQDIVKYKYLKNQTIHEVGHKLNDSPTWYDLLKVKNIYL